MNKDVFWDAFVLTSAILLVIWCCAEAIASDDLELIEVGTKVLEIENIKNLDVVYNPGYEMEVSNVKELVDELKEVK